MKGEQFIRRRRYRSRERQDGSCRNEIGHAAFVGADMQIEIDLTARLQTIELGNRPDFEGHRHCFHVVRNGHVADNHDLVFRLQSDDDTADEKDADGGVGW